MKLVVVKSNCPILSVLNYCVFSITEIYVILGGKCYCKEKTIYKNELLIINVFFMTVVGIVY